MKGKIIDIGTYVDEFGNKTYRISIETEEEPKVRLGNCEIKQ